MHQKIEIIKLIIYKKKKELKECELLFGYLCLMNCVIGIINLFNVKKEKKELTYIVPISTMLY